MIRALIAYHRLTLSIEAFIIDRYMLIQRKILLTLVGKVPVTLISGMEAAMTEPTNITDGKRECKRD
jgi:hypothetical protein